MKHGMRRKCDDERRNFCLKVLAVVLAVAGAVGYGWWQTSRPSAARRAEGQELASRAERLLADAGAMGADLEGMSRGGGTGDRDNVSFYQAACTPERREEAQRQAEAWTAANGVERDRGGEVMEGLGGGTVDELRREWERQMARLRQEKERLERAVQGPWVRAGRYEAAKKALEEALEEPERLWALRGEWAAARKVRSDAYTALYALPMSERLVEETREALERFSQEAPQALSAARKRWEESHAARQRALAEAIDEVNRLWRELSELHAENTAQVAAPETSGLPKALQALHDLEKRQGDEARDQGGALDIQGRAADRVLAQVRGQLSSLNGKDIRTEGIAGLCQTALGSTNAFGDIAKELDRVLSEESRARADADSIRQPQLAEARRILAEARKAAPTAAHLETRRKELNAERTDMRKGLRNARAAAEKTRKKAEEKDWPHGYEAEREARQGEVEEAIARAEKDFPPDARTLANGNALAEAESVNEARKELVSGAKWMQAAWERRVDDAAALEKALAQNVETKRQLQDMETLRRGEADSVEQLQQDLAASDKKLAERLEKVWRSPVVEGTVPSVGESAEESSNLKRRVANAARAKWIGPIEYVDVGMPGAVGWGPGARSPEQVFKKQELEALRGSDLPQADSGSRGPFGMRFSLVLPDDAPHRVVVGFGKDSGVRLKGANTVRGSSRSLTLSTKLRVAGGEEESGEVVLSDTTALIQANKKPVASVAVQGRLGQRVDLEFEGTFDSDGVDWSHIFFGVYLADSRGKELRSVVGKLQHVERVRKIQ